MRNIAKIVGNHQRVFERGNKGILHRVLDIGSQLEAISTSGDTWQFLEIIRGGAATRPTMHSTAPPTTIKNHMGQKIKVKRLRNPDLKDGRRVTVKGGRKEGRRPGMWPLQ